MRKIFNTVIYIFAGIGFIMIAVYIALQLGLTKTSGIIDTQHDYFKNQMNGSTTATSTADSDMKKAVQGDAEAWKQGEEWQALKEAILKDRPAIEKACKLVGILPRSIVAILIVEQLRLFHSNREIFKSVFAPLKILGNQSQFSWGVMGIKQETARQTEENLVNKASPWYLGLPYSHLLDYEGTSRDTNLTSNSPSIMSPSLDSDQNIDALRFGRLTNEDDRYYSYLYAAIIAKQIETQWKNAGFPISDRPDIIATLFNIGFSNSHPNANPQVGGAEIDIGSTTYSFGGLAGSFYVSSELIEEFPR